MHHIPAQRKSRCAGDVYHCAQQETRERALAFTQDHCAYRAADAHTPS